MKMLTFVLIALLNVKCQSVLFSVFQVHLYSAIINFLHVLAAEKELRKERKNESESIR